MQTPAAPPADALAPIDPTARARLRACRRVVIGAVLVGVICRVAAYLWDPAYWNDEAAVVLNVIDRGWRHLLRPLDYAQAAPPLFLWAERGLYLLLGAGEMALRAFPVMLGLIALPLFARLAWRVLPPVGAVWAVVWFGLSDKVIDHVSEVKQYSCDLLAPIAVLLASLGRKEGTSPASRLAGAAAVTVVAAWFSFPVVFVFGAVSIALLPGLLRGHRLRGAAVWLACNSIAAASFAALYFRVIRLGHDPYLDEHWQQRHAFTDLHRFPTWLAARLYEFANYPFPPIGAVLAILAVCGIVALARRGRGWLAATFVLAVLLHLMAATVRAYPFLGAHRLSLYLLPLLLLVAAAGADPALALVRDRRLIRAWIILPAIASAVCVSRAAQQVVAPEVQSTIRPVVEYVRANRKREQPIVLAGSAGVPGRTSGRNVEFLCYWRNPPGMVYPRLAPLAEVLAEARGRRFWVVYSLDHDKRRAGEQPTHAQRLEAFYRGARVVKHYHLDEQSGAILFERVGLDDSARRDARGRVTSPLPASRSGPH